jgi:hypothetical protein
MKNIFQCIVIMALFASFYSCEKMIEPRDEGLLNKDAIMKRPAYAEGVLLTSYTFCPISQYSFNYATDDAVHNKMSNGYSRMASGELSEQFNPATRWGKYSSIFYANLFLENVDGVTWTNDSLENVLFARRLRGEALALRALGHFFILQAHAGSVDGELTGIPYYKEFIESNENFNVPRLSFTATVDAIIADFDEAFEYLPYLYSGDAADILPKDQGYDQGTFLNVNSTKYQWRISGRIVKGLQAKVELFAASPAFLNGAGHYEKAADNAIFVLDELGFSLPLEGVEYYDADLDIDNPEILWRAAASFAGGGLEQNNFPPSLYGKGQLNPTHNLVMAFPMADGTPATVANGYSAQDPYAGRDPRLAKYIISNGSSYKNNKITTGLGGGLDRVDSILDLSTRTGYYLKKLLRSDVILNNTGGVATGKKHFDTYLRATELFLILAEAQNELGGPDYKYGASTMSAKDIIRDVRARALGIVADPYLDAQTTPDAMRTLIQNERRLELCFEGQRFWDLRRWNLPLNETATGYFYSGSSYIPFDVENRFDATDADYSRYLPIPDKETLKFSELEQNDNW